MQQKDRNRTFFPLYNKTFRHTLWKVWMVWGCFSKVEGEQQPANKNNREKTAIFPLNGGGKSLKMITQSKIRMNYHEFNSFNRVFNIIGMWISVKCGGLWGKTDSPHRNSVKKLLNTAAHSSCRIPERTMGVWLKGITKRSATEPAQPALGSFAP